MDLHQLMTVAELCARKPITDPGESPVVLLIEHDGELDIMVLGIPCFTTAVRVRQLIAEHRATSAAVVVETTTSTTGRVQTVVYVHGETADGAISEWRYRVRTVGRRRHLVPLTADEPADIERAFRPLFPVYLRPGVMDSTLADGAQQLATGEQSVVA